MDTAPEYDCEIKQSMTPLRPKKPQVIELVLKSSPDLLEIFREIQEPEGWRKFSSRLTERRKQFHIDDYVLLYEKEASISSCLLHSFQSAEEIKALSNRLEAEGVAAQQAYIDSVANDALLTDDDELNDMFSHAFLNEKERAASFEGLSPDEQSKLMRQAQYFLAFFISWFHNVIAVMVLGEKLTSLVPKAIAGDDDAFCKAIHIDKAILNNHPYFRDRYEAAQSNREEAFLKRVGRNMAAWPTRGKIRYPGLYLIFATLESLNSFDDFKHSEILDLCDQAGFDRWQNRIEDVGYLTKRLIEYRRFQKTSSMSMQ